MAEKFIAVTGSNGKTTVSYLLYQAWKILNHSCGYIGTLGYGLSEPFQSSGYTTPLAEKMTEIIKKFTVSQVEYIALEASSHALDQKRLHHLPIETAVFTNLTPEHLNYHGTLQAYQAAKLKLFTDFPLRYVVLNHADTMTDVIKDQLSNQAQCLTTALIYSKNCKSADIKGEVLENRCDGMLLKVDAAGEEIEFDTSLCGIFNADNLLMVLGVLLHYGISLNQAGQVLAQLKAPAGRMQRIASHQHATAMIDYAHTPDALLKLLTAIKSINPHSKVWLVFGCGGGGDIEKRIEMGKIADTYADHCILANDNPRDEDPLEIIEQIKRGMTSHNPQIILDRKLAIISALSQAEMKDIVVIAGKGHEQYQVIQDKKTAFCDATVVKEYFNEFS